MGKESIPDRRNSQCKDLEEGELRIFFLEEQGSQGPESEIIGEDAGASFMDFVVVVCFLVFSFFFFF